MEQVAEREEAHTTMRRRRSKKIIIFLTNGERRERRERRFLNNASSFMYIHAKATITPNREDQTKHPSSFFISQYWHEPLNGEIILSLTSSTIFFTATTVQCRSGHRFLQSQLMMDTLGEWVLQHLLRERETIITSRVHVTIHIRQ